MSYATSVIKSIQRGTVSYTTTALSATATITSVDTTKTAIIFLGEQLTPGGGGTPRLDNLNRITLTNATTVTANRDKGTDNNGNTAQGTVSFTVVEYY